MLPQTANIIPLFQVFGQWDLLDTTIGVIFADTALLMPFAVMLMRPFFRAVPHELEEASALDGSTRIGTFWRVALPVARNGAAAGGTGVFMLAWGGGLDAANRFLSPRADPLGARVAPPVAA